MIREASVKDFKIAFFDLDGTLLNSRGVASSSSKEAVDYLRSAGLHISLATGRSSFGSQDAASYLGIDDPCAFCSGSYIVNPMTKAVLFQVFLEAADLQEVTRICRANRIFEELYTAEDYFIEAANPIADIHSKYMGKYPSICNFDELIGNTRLLKATLVAKGVDQEAALEHLQQVLPSLNVQIAPGATEPDLFFANVTDPKASRENAFHTILKHLKIEPHEAIAFGDAKSDIPFLKMAGLGIALGNAEDAVKDVADYVTLGVDEEGILAAVNALFRGK